MTMTRGAIVLLAAAAALVQLERRAAACGGFFTEVSSSSVATMSDIRVLFVSQPGHVDQYVQIGYSGSATRFAWVYPVPGNPDVAEVKDSPFARLEEHTRPKITIYTHHGSDGGGGCAGFGCAGDAALGGDGTREAPPAVRVWQTGQVGAFDYAVITATNVSDMLGWLSSNGFAVSSKANELFAHYIAQQWFFVAMKVSVTRPQAEVPSTTVVRFGYTASEVRYPLRMVSLSPAALTSLEIYILSTEPLSPAAPFNAVQIDPETLVATSPTTHNYDEAFAATLEAGGLRALVREYNTRVDASVAVSLVGALSLGSSPVLTRLRTRWSADAMDQDLLFVPDAAPFTVVPDYHLNYQPAEMASFPPVLAAAAALWLLRSLLRRRSAR